MARLSCRYLQRAIYCAPDELRHCCKRFYVDGEMRGDVQIFPVETHDDVAVEKIIAAKQGLVDAINRGEDTACSGCPFLEEAEWPEVSDEKIELVSIEHHSHCNMRCTYCNDMFYGGLNANYDLKSLLQDLKNKDRVSETINIAWGGGEPTMLKEFDDLFDFVDQELHPQHQRIFTNAIIYSDRIAAGLEDGSCSIATSVDAGSVETFKKVRKVNQYKKVMRHLKQYYDHGAANMVIKYIFTEDNYAIAEVESFVADVKAHGMTGTNFLISANYRSEDLSAEQGLATIYLHYLLSEAGAKSVAYDDHLRPRVNKITADIMARREGDLPPGMVPVMQKLRELDRLRDAPIIVWGAGEYANFLLENSLTFKDADVLFFVDRDQQKQKTTFRGCRVEPPKQVLQSDAPILVASSFYHFQIAQELEAMGIASDRIIPNFYI